MSRRGILGQPAPVLGNPLHIEHFLLHHRHVLEREMSNTLIQILVPLRHELLDEVL